MTSGYVTVAGVTRKSRRKHAIGGRYVRYVTSPMRRFTQLSGVEMVRNTVYNVATWSVCTPDPGMGISNTWVLAGPQLMTATLLNYVRYGSFRPKNGPSCVLRVHVSMRATMMSRCGLL